MVLPNLLLFKVFLSLSLIGVIPLIQERPLFSYPTPELTECGDHGHRRITNPVENSPPVLRFPELFDGPNQMKVSTDAIGHLRRCEAARPTRSPTSIHSVDTVFHATPYHMSSVPDQRRILIV